METFLGDKLEIFEKVDGKWQSIGVDYRFKGKSLREIYSSFHKTETVAKLTSDGKVVGYIAGNKELYDFYAKKKEPQQFLISFEQAVAKMEKANSKFLDTELEQWLSKAGEVFKGIKLESLDISRERSEDGGDKV